MIRKLLDRLRAVLSPAPQAGDTKYEHAMRLADDVSGKIRERANSSNPFREVLSEMIFGQLPADPGVIADAFEMGQESRIFRGAPNGHG